MAPVVSAIACQQFLHNCCYSCVDVAEYHRNIKQKFLLYNAGLCGGCFQTPCAHLACLFSRGLLVLALVLTLLVSLLARPLTTLCVAVDRITVIVNQLLVILNESTNSWVCILDEILTFDKR